MLSKINHHSVPYLSILVSPGTLLLVALLNFIFPDATQLFIYVTTLSTVLFIVVWVMITISYIIYVQKNPEGHKHNKFKPLGGKVMAYVILAFFLFVFVLLFFSADTRVAICISPIWFTFLLLFYKKYKKNAEYLVEKTRQQPQESIDH